MNASISAFLEHLIDYAGMFPPASLELEPSARNYLAYQRQPESWMLGRYICPAARIPELNAFLTKTDGRPIPVSMLASSATGAAECLEALEGDLAQLRQQLASGSRIRVEVVEARIPPALATADAGAELESFLAAFRSRVANSGLPIGEVYFEAAVEAKRAQIWERTLQALAALRRSRLPGQPSTGFKVRCGGATPKALPAAEELALVLERTRVDRLQLKATAGLHHPVRRFDPASDTTMHGFFNLFGAGVVAHANPLALHDLAEILREEDAGSFRFAEDGMAWRGLHCPTELIHQARARHLSSFGSCSFDEPRQDLASLGLLPGPRAGATHAT